jgi:hypothetical protein
MRLGRTLTAAMQSTSHLQRIMSGERRMERGHDALVRVVNGTSSLEGSDILPDSMVEAAISINVQLME